MTNVKDDAKDSVQRKPDCPPWCTKHDDSGGSDIHFGNVHTVDLDCEEEAIGLQLEEIVPNAKSPGQLPLIHLQQTVGRDGVSLMPDEARALAKALTALADRLDWAADARLHPLWCEDRSASGSEHDHRGRSYHYDAVGYAFQASVQAWDEPHDRSGLSDLYVALSIEDCEDLDHNYELRLPYKEVGGLIDLLRRVAFYDGPLWWRDDRKDNRPAAVATEQADDV